MSNWNLRCTCINHSRCHWFWNKEKKKRSSNIMQALLGPVSISNKTSYRKILWSLGAARLVVWIITSLWNLTGTSAALLLPRCLPNFRAIILFEYKSRSFETTRNLTIRCLVLICYRNWALVPAGSDNQWLTSVTLATELCTLFLPVV